MDWNPNYRYKLIGKLINANGELLIIFDLTSAEVYERVIREGKKPVRSRTPVFPKEWQTQFGLPVEEHRNSLNVNFFNAYYNSLTVMMQNGFHSISFPLISAGIFGGSLADPVGESAKQCLRAYTRFTRDFPDYDINVVLCAFSQSESAAAKKIFDHVIFDNK